MKNFTSVRLSGIPLVFPPKGGRACSSTKSAIFPQRSWSSNSSMKLRRVRCAMTDRMNHSLSTVRHGAASEQPRRGERAAKLSAKP